MSIASKPMITTITCVLLLGAAHGYWTDRWKPSPDLQRSLDRLDRFPMNVGDWRGENVAYEPEDMSRSGIQGCVFRKYQNFRTGATVNVLLVCGRGGPISVHTPDVCYAAAGYQQLGAEERTQAGASIGDFWKGYFSLPNAVVPKRLEIFWAWSRDGSSWSAPDRPRYSFGRYRSLYKLYVVRETPAKPRPEDDSVTRDFMTQILPELRNAFADAP